MITQSRLKELLDYDPSTGVFRWRVSRGKASAGDVAGTPHPTKVYRYIYVDGHNYKAHRLAWLYVYGDFPNDQLDHINGDRSFNAISNLRECGAREQSFNKKTRKDNFLGLKGVHKIKTTGRFRATIHVDKKRIHLGVFGCPTKAHLVYQAAARKLHGEFARW